MAKEIITTIHIAASPAIVWSILMDFAHYSDWNPFIQSIEGEATVGKKITARLCPPGGSPMTFKPVVLKAEHAKEFRWLGHLWIPGIFDGEHRFELKAMPDGTVTFVQAERFKGILVPLMKKMLDTKTKAGFEQMNNALKLRAEAV